jgi:hypothetical protein
MVNSGFGHREGFKDFNMGWFWSNHDLAQPRRSAAGAMVANQGGFPCAAGEWLTWRISKI